MKTKLFILICFLLAGKIVYTQSIYTMPVAGTQTDTVCGGTFYDSGGPTVNYSNLGNGILVFYPAVQGQYVMVQFTSLVLMDGGDRLRIFSGTDTMGVPLATFAGPTSSAGCGTILVSTDSTNGCLTMHFKSDAVGVAAGWRAMLYCNPTISIMIPGITCAIPVVIPSIPFTDTDQCTECMLNDYQSQSGICNVSYAGEDRVYQYTASGTETVCITMSNTTGNPTLAIYSGCPGVGGSCLTPIPMVGNDSMQFTFPSAGTYYIIIDEPSGYSCYDLSIVSCIVGINEQENLNDEVLVFPNPVTSELKIENSELRIREIEICNLLGETIFKSQISNLKSQILVDVSQFYDGFYLVKITDEKNNSVTRKIVKM